MENSSRRQSDERHGSPVVTLGQCADAIAGRISLDEGIEADEVYSQGALQELLAPSGAPSALEAVTPVAAHLSERIADLARLLPGVDTYEGLSTDGVVGGEH